MPETIQSLRRFSDTKIFNEGGGLLALVGNTIAVEFHGTYILLCREGENQTQLKNRMNHISEALDLGFTVFTENGDWKIRQANGNIIPFTDKLVKINFYRPKPVPNA